jgi:hypothetical protein
MSFKNSIGHAASKGISANSVGLTQQPVGVEVRGPMGKNMSGSAKDVHPESGAKGMGPKFSAMPK